MSFGYKSPLTKCLTAYKTVMQTKQSEEGISHINVYSESKLELGRKLSNFSRLGFTHPTFGTFASAEAAWVWLSTGKKWDNLKEKWGVQAKLNGQGKVKVPNDNFQVEFIECLHCKLAQNPELLELLRESTLPLLHYYVFARGIKDAMKGNEFWIRELEEIRKGREFMGMAE